MLIHEREPTLIDSRIDPKISSFERHSSDDVSSERRASAYVDIDDEFAVFNLSTVSNTLTEIQNFIDQQNRTENLTRQSTHLTDIAKSYYVFYGQNRPSTSLPIAAAEFDAALDLSLSGTDLVPLSKVFHLSGFVIVIFSVFALFLYFLGGLNLIHPLLSITLIVFGVGIAWMGHFVPRDIQRGLEKRNSASGSNNTDD